VEGPIGVGKSSLAHKLSQTYKYYEEKEIITDFPTPIGPSTAINCFFIFTAPMLK
jgi:thymidylate kinase